MENTPIIKKIKKVSGGGHHGGAWKVAYADFVTAMMAFFLLMWLLNATSDEQKRGISIYFGPIGDKSGGGGTGGLLGGQAMSSSGNYFDDQMQMSSISFSDITPKNSEESDKTTGVHDFERKGDDAEESPGTASQDPLLQENELNQKLDEFKKEETSPEFTGTESDQIKKKNAVTITRESIKEKALKKLTESFSDEEIKALSQKDILRDIRMSLQEKLTAEKSLQEDIKKFERIKKQIEETLKKNPEFAGFKDNVLIDMTPEGLRIQLIDRENAPMFPNGSADMPKHTEKILSKIANLIKNLSNKISITGHTDAKPFYNERSYSNWELSSDRALASRRIFVENLGTARIARVAGKSDTDLLNKENPYAPENRRIGIVLLHSNIDRALSN